MILNQLICPICGSSEKIKIKDMIICRKCGAILESNSFLKYDISAYSFNADNRKIFIISSRAKKYIKLLEEIGEYLEIPYPLIKRAEGLIRNILSKMKDLRLNQYVVIATSLIISSYESGDTLTYRDIEKFLLMRYNYKLNRTKVIQLLAKLRELGIYKFVGKPNYLSVTNLYLNRILKELKIYEHDREYYEKMWKLITELNENLSHYLQGKSVKSVASILIYLAEMWLSKKENRRPYFSQNKLAGLIGISRYTIRERIQEIYSLRGHSITVLKEYAKRRN